jgi:serine/threonine protein kinase
VQRSSRYNRNGSKPARIYISQRKTTDNFDNLSEIYQGAISTVFHATCRRTGREVVLKAYHKERMDERHRMRLAREIDVQQEIQRKAAPHVCELIDAFEDDDDVFLVLERCDGGDVFALQHENGGCLNESFVCTVRL